MPEAPPLLSDEAILRGLNANPRIKGRIASMLAVVEDAAGDLKQADAAEARVIEEIRRMGQEALQAWAERQVEATEQALRQRGQAHREGKKNSAGTPALAKSGSSSRNIGKAVSDCAPLRKARKSITSVAHGLYSGR